MPRAKLTFGCGTNFLTTTLSQGAPQLEHTPRSLVPANIARRGISLTNVAKCASGKGSPLAFFETAVIGQQRQAGQNVRVDDPHGHANKSLIFAASLSAFSCAILAS